MPSPPCSNSKNFYPQDSFASNGDCPARHDRGQSPHRTKDVHQTQTILRDLGNGLIMRRSTPEDADALSEFNGKIHGDDPLDAQRVAAWTRDLLARPHPTLNPDDFTIVEGQSPRDELSPR